MKDIRNLMENYRINENDESFLPEDQLTRQEKDRIMKMTMEKLSGEMKQKGSRSKMKLITIAAAMVLCLGTVAAFATGYFPISDSFKSFFGMEQSQEAVVAGMSTPIGKTIENNGWKADFKEIIGDSKSVYILFDVIAPEGTELNGGSYTFDGSRIDFKKEKHGLSSGWYFEVLESEDKPGDNIVPMVMCADCSRDINGKTLEIVLDKFTAYMMPDDEHEEGYDKVYDDAYFETSIRLEYQDNSIEHKVNKDLNVAGKDATVKSIKISPISIIVNYYSKNLDEVETYGDGENFGLDLIMKDGSVYNTWRGAMTSQDKYNIEQIYSAEKVLNPADIKSVVLHGTQIEL